MQVGKRRSFRWSFRQVSLPTTSPYQLDTQPDLTSENGTLQHGMDGGGSTSNPRVGVRIPPGAPPLSSSFASLSSSRVVGLSTSCQRATPRPWQRATSASAAPPGRSSSTPATTRSPASAATSPARRGPAGRGAPRRPPGRGREWRRCCPSSAGGPPPSSGGQAMGSPVRTAVHQRFQVELAADLLQRQPREPVPERVLPVRHDHPVGRACCLRRRLVCAGVIRKAAPPAHHGGEESVL